MILMVYLEAPTRWKVMTPLDWRELDQISWGEEDYFLEPNFLGYHLERGGDMLIGDGDYI